MFKIFILILFFVKVNSFIDHNNQDRLSVAIYYESLCPDCMRFFSKQFAFAYKKIGSYLNVDLIPFGNAKAFNESGHWKFVCQHGVKECHGNKVHGCVLTHNSPRAGVEFVNCAMSLSDPSDDRELKNCARSCHIEWDNIEECLKDGQADKIMAKYGSRTKSVHPRINGVPAIAFNNHYDPYIQDKAANEFLKVACGFLDYKPSACHQYSVVMI